MKAKIFFVALILLLLGTACEADQNFSDPVILDEGTVVKLEDFSFQFVGSFHIESEGNITKDILNVTTKLEDTDIKIDYMKLGYDFGFTGANAEVKKRDSFLVMILKYNADDAITSQRDSIIPKMKIKALDDKNEKLILVHNSLEKDYIQVENPFGILVFKMYSDTKIIFISFDDKSYELIIE